MKKISLVGGMASVYKCELFSEDEKETMREAYASFLKSCACVTTRWMHLRIGDAQICMSTAGEFEIVI